MSKEVKVSVKAVRRVEPDLHRLAHLALRSVLDDPKKTRKTKVRPSIADSPTEASA